ncbi:VWA domain-containing protein [Thiocystis violacea]|uniref:VWA domain-containing protein n=1 Tax=Thiocystis violacea TaxID=13725 RepID=UPI001904380D|nr:VWA domain-containing protein [Thiocystis violacea]MBK1722005.1 BatB protein [Thiocystis violacea]
MIVLEWPWALAALPLPLLARLLRPAAQDVGLALRLPFDAGLDGLAPEARRGSGWWRLAAAILIWLLLLLAAARPQWLGDPIGLPVAGRDLMLAVDISQSMEQVDYELSGQAVSRLAAVQAVAADFIERREQDRLGLILFGTQAYLQTPMTFDAKTVATMLRDSVVGLAGRQTAIGDAIGLAVKRLRDQPEGQRVLVLLTDGDNTAGTLQPLEAAELAAKAGIRVYAIGIGGGDVGIRTPLGIRLLKQGSDFDPTTLKEIARITGGRFFAASNREELEAVYADLDRLEPNEREERTYRPQRALFMWPAGAALLLSTALALGGLMRRLD